MERSRWTSTLRRILPLACLAAGLLAPTTRAQTLSDPNLIIDPDFNVGGIVQAVAMSFVSADEILVLERKTGRVRYVDDGVLQATPALDVHVNSFSERGLLSIEVNSEDPPRVFLYYTEADGADEAAPLGNRIYRYDWNPTTKVLENPLLLFDLPALPGPQHNGGILELGPPGEAPGVGDGALLYAIIGDLNTSGQLTNVPAGTAPNDRAVILRIRQDGSPAPGNPFTPYCSVTTTQTCAGGGGCPGGETCIDEVESYYAYGVRNSFGMALDPITGDLWDTENGAGTYDEVNRVTPGFNSGWQQIMGPDALDPQGTGDLFDMPGAGSTYSDPEFSWFDTTAPTSIVFPHGGGLGAVYDEVALVGDNNSGQLYRLPLDATRTGFDFSEHPALLDLIADDNTERDLLAIGHFNVITDLEIGPDGALYVVSIGNGNIKRVIAAGPFVPALGTWALLALAALTLATPLALRKRRGEGAA